MKLSKPRSAMQNADDSLCIDVLRERVCCSSTWPCLRTAKISKLAKYYNTSCFHFVVPFVGQRVID